MKRGEVWWVDFDPSIGGEIQKRRPAVIVSNDASNRFPNHVQVIPLTSNVGRAYLTTAAHAPCAEGTVSSRPRAPCDGRL